MLKLTYAVLIILIINCYSFGQTEIKQTILFDFDKAVLNDPQKKILDSIYVQLKSTKDFSVSLQGHTDNSGSQHYNDLLSAKRSSAIKNYFYSKHLDTSRIKLENYGEKKPLVENSSRKNRSLNRRVEMTILIPSTPLVIISPTVAPTNSENQPPPAPKTNVMIITSAFTSTNKAIVEMITSTAQMEEANLTTMTIDNAPLASNVMVCITKPPGVRECELKEPITVKIPINNRGSCNPMDILYYDSKKDSLTEITRWKEIPKEYTTEQTDTVNYFVITVTNLCSACKNFDCPKPDSLIKFRLIGAKLKFTDLKLIYKNTNALLAAYKFKKKIWAIRSIRQPLEDPVIKIKAVNKKGIQHSFETNLSNVPKNKKGICLIDKNELIETK
jgi:hypothetical protein